MYLNYISLQPIIHFMYAHLIHDPDTSQGFGFLGAQLLADTIWFEGQQVRPLHSMQYSLCIQLIWRELFELC